MKKRIIVITAVYTLLSVLALQANAAIVGVCLLVAYGGSNVPCLSFRTAYVTDGLSNCPVTALADIINLGLTS
jgi:hypothetical protein